MNILFHLAAGFGIALAICEKPPIFKQKSVITAVVGCFIGFVAHGFLDYAPHCYPVNSKIDFIFGFLLLAAASIFAKRYYKFIMFFTLLGSVLPDIIDLLPPILNSQLGLNLPIYDKLFPWHWSQFSGSIYDGDCDTSNVNISLVLIGVLGIAIAKMETLKKMYLKNH